MLVGSALHVGPACAFELDFIQLGPIGGSAARRAAVLAGASPAGAIPHLAP